MTSKVTNDGTSDTESVTYRYNLQNRLQRVITDSDPLVNTNDVSVVDYTYNTSGIRISKYNFTVAQNYLDTVDEQTQATDKVITVYLIDPANHTGYAQVLEETTYDLTTPTEADKIQYTLGDDVISQTKSSGTLSADQWTWTASPTQYLIYDGHGSTRQLINTNLSVQDSYSYDATFGP